MVGREAYREVSLLLGYVGRHVHLVHPGYTPPWYTLPVTPWVYLPW